MGLEKLIIKAEKEQAGNFTDVIKVLFNPEKLQISRRGWTVNDKGPVAASELTTITTELFFDTTLPGSTYKNVQHYTREIFKLTQPLIGIDPKRPPRCQLVWGTILGKDGVLMPDGFLESVTKTLTHFLEDGTPVRATLNCTFREWIEPQKGKKIENPINDPVRIVRRGETLSSIAGEEYGDPALWRVIALENRLEDPRVVPGQVLTVPPLQNAAVQRR
jgi:nucleoid-associated protein YgaU